MILAQDEKVKYTYTHMKASSNPYKSLTVIPTGYAGLDKITGLGGIPTRKITEISGQFSVGKSTIALSIVARAQQMKMDTLYIDSEFSFDEKYARVLGVDTDDLDLICERFAEANLDAAEEWIEKHKKALVVLDSIGGLLPRAEAEKGSDGKVIGGQAKLIATFCRKIIPLLAINNIALVILNHEFTDIMSGKLKTSGGAKLEYAKSLWIRLRKLNKRVMSGENQVGDIIEAEIRKNKLAGTTKQSAELTLLYGQGFLKGADVMQEAIDKLVITKQGQSYFLGSEKIARGQAALRDLFQDSAFKEKVQSLL